MISPLLVSELERVRKAEHELCAEVSMERDWRQRHEREASRNKEAVHRLFARHQLDAHSRTNSCVARESSREASPMSPHRRAPLAREPRSPMLSISPNRIREINDPCSRILNQLHKILFISQLPPSMEGELKRLYCAITRARHKLVFVETDDATGLARRCEPIRVGGQLSEYIPA